MGVRKVGGDLFLEHYRWWLSKRKEEGETDGGVAPGVSLERGGCWVHYKSAKRKEKGTLRRS